MSPFSGKRLSPVQIKKIKQKQLVICMLYVCLYRIVGYFPKVQIFLTKGHPALAENFPRASYSHVN